MRKSIALLAALAPFLCQAVTISQTVVNPSADGIPPRGDSTPTAQTYSVRLRITGYNELTPGAPITPEIVGPASIAPGTSHTFAYNYDHHDPATDEVHYRTISTEVFRSGVWVEVGNSRVVNGDGAGGSWESIDAIINPTSDVESSVQITPSSAPQGTPEDAKTVWLVADTTLTANLFREGVDKIVYANSSSGGGAGGGGTTEAQDTYFAQQARLTNQTNANADASTLYAETGAAATGTAKKALVESAFANRVARAVGSSSTPTNAMTLHLPRAFKGISEIVFDPMHYDTTAALCGFIKKVLAWVIVMTFEFFLWGYLTGSYRTLSLSVPAKGNPVMGGTGAQATSLIVATAITGVILSFPTLFWGLADTGFTWGSSVTQNPFEAASSGPTFLEMAGYLAGCFLPVDTLIASITSYLLVLRGGLIILAGAQTLVRYFVA